MRESYLTKYIFMANKQIQCWSWTKGQKEKKKKKKNQALHSFLHTHYLPRNAPPLERKHLDCGWQEQYSVTELDQMELTYGSEYVSR